MNNKSFVLGECSNLFDPDTGAWVGVVDRAGNETMVPTAQVDPVTGGVKLSVGSNPVVRLQQTPVGRYSPAWAVVAKLRATIIANGGTVSEADLLALRDPLDRLIRSTAWAKIVELWIPVGNSMAAALCKIKGSTLSMTGNNLVDADYTRWLGISGNGTNKDIVSGFNPSALTASWGCGVYPTGVNTPAGGKMLLGDGSTTYLGFGNGDCKINGSSSIPLSPARRFMAMQNNIAGGAGGWYGGFQAATVAAGSTNAAAIRLMSYAGSFYSDISIGGFAAWSPVLTAAEMRSVSDFFDESSYLLGRLGVVNEIVATGDSNTVGFGLGSPATERWTALLAAEFGATENNNGISGSAMSATVGAGASAHWVDQHKVDNSKHSGVFMSCMFGTNDDRNGSTLAGFAADYETWLNYQFLMGWRPGNVIIISPIAATDALSSPSRQIAMRNTCAALATKYGCIYVDGYEATIGQPTYFQVDNLHLSTAGHSALKTAVMSAIAATTPSTAFKN